MDFLKGERYLLARSTGLISSHDVLALFDNTHVTVTIDNLISARGLPTPAQSVPGGGSYWLRNDVIAWWRRRHGFTSESLAKGGEVLERDTERSGRWRDRQ